MRLRGGPVLLPPRLSRHALPARQSSVGSGFCAQSQPVKGEPQPRAWPKRRIAEKDQDAPRSRQLLFPCGRVSHATRACPVSMVGFLAPRRLYRGPSALEFAPALGWEAAASMGGFHFPHVDEGCAQRLDSVSRHLHRRRSPSPRQSWAEWPGVSRVVLQAMKERLEIRHETAGGPRCLR